MSNIKVISPESCFPCRRIASYCDLNTQEIFLLYHRNRSEDLAFKILVFDIDHEVTHLVIKKLTDTKTSVAFDLVALKVTEWLQPDLLEEVLKGG